MHNFLQDILKEANTIIIPGLGALTVTSSKTGDIYFMPFLKHDDGHLAKYVSTHEGVELTEAKQILANFVEAIKTAIAEGDYFEMEEFGRFFTNKEGEIDFERWEDYQVKDNSILSKKIQERQQSQPKKVEKPTIEIKKEEPKVEPVIEPIILPIVESIIEPIIESVPEEEPISHHPVIEQKSIDELLGDSTEEIVIPLASIITPIEETIEIKEETQPTIEQHHTPTVEEIIEAPERDILVETDPAMEEEVSEVKTVITENKNTLRKKLIKEEKEEKEEEKRREKAAKLEAKELAKSTPKEKKKSRSILLWLFFAIIITSGVMWYIKTQRDGEVHLTIIDKKESKVVASKVIEKEELRDEIAKHRQNEEDPSTKQVQGTITSRKEVKTNVTKNAKDEKVRKEKAELVQKEKKERAKTAKLEEVKREATKNAKDEAMKKEKAELVQKEKKDKVKKAKEEEIKKIKNTSATVNKGTTSTIKPNSTASSTATAVKPVVSTSTTTTSKTTPTLVKPVVSTSTTTTSKTTPTVVKPVVSTSTTPTSKTTPTVVKPVVSTSTALTTKAAAPVTKPVVTTTTNKATSATSTVKPITTATIIPTTNSAKATTAQTSKNTNTGYVSPNKNIQVIVGTFKDKTSADQFVANLKTEGFSSAYSKEENGSFQVSLGSYSTLSESNKALQKYKSGKK